VEPHNNVIDWKNKKYCRKDPCNPIANAPESRDNSLSALSLRTTGKDIG